MGEVIEISEDSRSNDTPIVKNGEPDVYVLDDSLGCSRDNQQMNYPSSPRPTFNADEKSIEIIESNPPSSEILVPFCHELSSSNIGNGPSSSEVSRAINRGKPNRQSDRLLDRIVDCNSSPDSSAVSERTNEDVVTSMRDLAARWAKTSSRPSTKTDQSTKSPEMTPLAASQDVLVDFPLSSPVSGQVTHEKETKEISQDNKSECEPTPQSSPVKTKSAKSTQVDKINECTSNPKIRRTGSSRSKEVKSSSLRPDTVELNLSKFLSDRTWEETPSSSRRETNRIKKPNNNLPYVIANNRELEKSMLHQYILRGKYYTQQESESLLRYWLKEDKERLKQANQIYRSNENARSPIIVEMTSGLLELFQQTTKEIESLISPATLQIGYDKSLPRIRFLRRLTSIYDFNHDIYYPSELRIMEENVNILFYDAQQFFELYRSEKRKLFDVIQLFVKDNKYLIVILSDLNRFKRSVESLEETKYKAKVQEQLTGSQFAATQGKKMEDIEKLKMKSFDLEQRLRHIDRLWNVKLHVVNSTMEFISTLPNLVSIVGRQRMDPAIRFMRYSHIHVRSSKDRTDALKKTLHHINKMPELKCNSVTNAYPDFQSLFHDFQKGQLKSGLDGKHLMTEAMESRLYKLFTCQNPNETIQ
ncbi:hypothetical protein ZYGR_0AI06740 [Zygosaccharomyces rouxii]|uniref:ERCC4 domain-containing protein n=1 Tax=Zygosaccharomyces rouxii TaxID=4956 RepID=A0A1Q3ACN3_ZYGRO|nr:hypothetical protein ZYGR_0AI06740 [Zygosaccharomyces rouxii]